MNLTGSLLLLVFSVMFSAQLGVYQWADEGLFLLPLEEKAGMPYTLQDTSELKHRAPNRDKRFPSGKYSPAAPALITTAMPSLTDADGHLRVTETVYVPSKRYLLFHSWLFYS